MTDYIDAVYLATSRQVTTPPPPPLNPCAIANVLDLIPTQPMIAMSTTRKLKAAYAGAAFRVGRNSDSTEIDIVE